MLLRQCLKLLGVLALYILLVYCAFVYKTFSARNNRIVGSQVQNERNTTTISKPPSVDTVRIGRTRAAVINPRSSPAAKTVVKQGGKTVMKPWTEMPLLTPQFNGRLGNQMFEYASTYALARAKNMSLYVPSVHILNRLFPLDMATVTSKRCGGWHPVNAPCCSYDDHLVTRLDSSTCQSVGQYLQSWKFFHPVEESIRRQFTFKPSIADRAVNKLVSVKLEFLRRMKDGTRLMRELSNATGEVKQDLHRVENVSATLSVNLTYIGMHVRRGDYLSSMSRRQGRITPPAEYYIHAMRYFRAIFPNTLFVVAGDDGSWVNRNIGAPDVVVVQRDSAEVDLCVLSMCNHTILSVGTFGWWAGFLAGGTTVYYKHPYRNNTEMSRWYPNYDSDFVYPGWIAMS
ncbi:galactoside alpha-(1,2)-fucosyltransferase 2-like [Haliotis rubra]|uniref:galactoside alpha-(1,2)-fucosyltransferase 2-like n=1 Tax=Haliotis rubra TaxID=36100 RepID=UPI001EE5C80D|nr:galactoside alpha-(1,2)-fucosyltransferase 2-like [Haliotis rubra]